MRLKLIKTIKYYIILLLVMAFISGCFTANESHNYAHSRAIWKDIGLFHKDVVSFLGASEASMLSE